MDNSSAAPEKSIFAKLRRSAFAPIDNASLVFFRIAFGALMAWEVYRYFVKGRIYALWIEPRFLFKYYGFSWVEPLAGNGLYIAWCALGVVAFFLAIGFLYRLSVVLFFIGTSYFFLLDQAPYLNHMYLICLLSLLWIFVPANRSWAVDPLLKLAKRSQTTPAWTLWIFRFQMAVVYFYGGLAKLNPDWLRGEPMRTWTAGRTDLPILGRFIDAPWMPYFLSYGGLLLDLLIAPLLLWRRTRIPAFCVAVLFHFWNANMFNIGVFPWLATAATTLFLSPSWPRRLVAMLRRSPFFPGAPTEGLPGLGRQAVVLSLLGVYALIQLLVPFRHFLYPGNVDWMYEGHRFSWRMKLHDRDTHAIFYVTDPNVGTEIAVNPRTYLQPQQAWKMPSRSDMVLQFAHYLATIMPRKGPKPLRVEARVLVSLNGRKPAPLVNPTVDLAAEPRTLKPVRWLLPLNEPLPDPATAKTRKQQELELARLASLEERLRQLEALKKQLIDQMITKEQFKEAAAKPQEIPKVGPQDD